MRVKIYIIGVKERRFAEYEFFIDRKEADDKFRDVSAWVDPFYYVSDRSSTVISFEYFLCCTVCMKVSDRGTTGVYKVTKLFWANINFFSET